MTAKEFQPSDGGEVSDFTTQIVSEIKSEVTVQEPCQDVDQEISESEESVENKKERPHSRIEVNDVLIDDDTNVIDAIALTEKVVSHGAISSETAVQEPSQGLHQDMPESTTPVKNKFEEPRNVMLKDRENEAIGVVAYLEYEAVKSCLELEKLSLDQESESSTKQADEDVKDYILPIDNIVIEDDIKAEELSSFRNSKNQCDEVPIVSLDSNDLDLRVQINEKIKKKACLKESSCESSELSFELSSEFLNPEDSTPFEPIIKEPPAGLKGQPYTVKIRGMFNVSSACYIISTLQALFNCPDFAGLLHYACHLNESVLNDKTLPLTTSIVNMFSQVELGTLKPIHSRYIKRVLERIAGKRYGLTEQEDAEEILSAILNKLHDEEVAVVKNGDRSCVSDQFRGETRYFNLLEGGKVVQSDSPFYCLPLSIQEKQIRNVQKALDNDTGIGKEGETEKTLLKKLPKTLIVQLKCYNDDGTKIIKKFRVNKILKITSEHLNKEARENYSEKVKYRIRSVIFHRGAMLGAGHYIVNVFKNDEWICLNDETFKKVEEKEALRSERNKMPYILFYELCAEGETESDVEEEEDEEEWPDFERHMRGPRRKTRGMMNYDEPRMFDKYHRHRTRNIFELLHGFNDRDDVSGEESDTENEFRGSSKFDRRRLNMHDDRERPWNVAGRRLDRPPYPRDHDYELRPRYTKLEKDSEKRARKRNAKMRDPDED